MFCLSDEEIWLSGEDSIVRFFNFLGILLKLIKFKLGNRLLDIVMIERGYLIYLDFNDRLVNMV